MKSDTVLKVEGINLLIEKLGEVDAERFITLIIKEQFDYTKWQKELFKDLSVREISKNAMKNVQWVTCRLCEFDKVTNIW